MTGEYLDSPVPVALAHRGGWLIDGSGRVRTELENTAPAFEHAISLGYRYLETDVHATRDGVLLAFHDETLDRTTDRGGRIAELDYSEVARARVGGSEPIPVLEDLLGAWPDTRFNIDIKADNAVEPLVEVLRRTRAWNRVCVGSFSQRRLDHARAAFDRPVATSCGPVDAARLRFASLTPVLRWLVRAGVSCAQIPLRTRGFPVLSRDFIATAHKFGMQVHVWTINRPAVMARLLDAGVDGIVTDNTVALRRLLTERGEWDNSGPIDDQNRWPRE
ncbi:glycerophosphoryl diester phosphodiesterase [Lipingzhangella halophila]|uniref:Glycerophosphoryl diester phosphodiesterase n=1 Tax=Lipingzhangella halophila TaxID=1783352 RepID=A0A7W7RGH5_9ACTN|nr:glycerophosphodiester phosphodiesterase [Lipingzhangella halophila]MBB4931554.1 glycerophosphoryl diester phosphodiesterase [Lipingzhangella halophila]